MNIAGRRSGKIQPQDIHRKAVAIFRVWIRTLRGLRYPGIGSLSEYEPILKIFAIYSLIFSRAEYKFRNGSEIWFLGLDSKERVEKILGREFATVYFNECSEISYPAVTTAMTRLAQRVKLYQSEELLPNRAWFDCNPPGKSHWAYKLFVQKVEPENNTALLFPDSYDSMLINPQGNRHNLGEGYLEETLAAMPERQRQRFLEGCWLDDMEGALWKREMIDRARVINAPPMRRVVIGVDPAVTGKPESDETGIIVAGRDAKGEYYVLYDDSRRDSPMGWARVSSR